MAPSSKAEPIPEKRLSSAPIENPPERSAETAATYLEDRLPDVFTSLFAVWTICSNVAVFLQGTPLQALILFAVGGAACVTLLIVFRSCSSIARAAPLLPIAPAVSSDRLVLAAPGTRMPARIAAFGIAIGLAVVFACTNSYVLFWWLAIGYFAIAVLLSSEKGGTLPVVDKRARGILWSTAAAAVLLCLFAHRSDADDCLYLAIGSYTADHPHMPILGADPLRISGGFPLLFAPHKVESLCIGSGVLSYVTGLDVLPIMHFILPAVAAVLGLCAQAKLFKELLPRTWLPAVLLLQIVLLAMADTHRSYGNFSWVRLHQGKGVFVTVLVPLILAYGIRFGRRPDCRGFWLLAASEIASLGLTSTALWVAPIIGFLATVSGALGTKNLVRAGGALCLAAVYQAAVALLLRSELSGAGQIDLLSNFASGEALMEDSLSKVLGRTPLSLVSACLVMGCWAVAPAGPARRLAAVLPGGFLLFLFNPYTAARFGDQVGTYWRIFWVLPIPLLTALTLASFISSKKPSALTGKHSVASFLGAGLLCAIVWACIQRCLFNAAPAQAVFRMLGESNLAGLLATGLAMLALIAGFVYYGWKTPAMNRTAVAAVAWFTLLYFVFLPRQYVLAESNRVRFGWPSPKVDRGYRPAMWLCAHCASEDVILAPEEVVVWVPSRRGHPMSLISQATWDPFLAAHLGKEELETRKLLRACVAGDTETFPVTQVTAALRRGDLAAICFHAPMKQAAALRSALATEGHACRYQDGTWEIWMRSNEVRHLRGGAPATTARSRT